MLVALSVPCVPGARPRVGSDAPDGRNITVGAQGQPGDLAPGRELRAIGGYRWGWLDCNLAVGKVQEASLGP